MEKQYKIYRDGNDYCAETNTGKWIVANRDEVKILKGKPARFKNYTLMTEAGIRADEDANRLIAEEICTEELLTNESLPKLTKAIYHLIRHLEQVKQAGGELSGTIINSSCMTEIPLKPVDKK